MPPTKPSLELLRSLTDESVLQLLMSQRRMTRAEIAARTGISKTTISESMRRLGEIGLVTDTGERTTGRGRSGSYYALADGSGCGLVVGIGPTGVAAEAVDALGRVVVRADVPLGRSAGEREASEALRRAAGEIGRAVPARPRLCVVSAADPVDRETGRLVQLPDAPFLLGQLDPVAVLSPFVDGDVLVDNDVNWVARAERAAGAAVGVDDFVLLYLGEGLGCAVVSDGEVRRGHRGIAGEVAHVVVRGPSGTAVPFTRVFAELGLRTSHSTAVDLDRVTSVVQAPGPEHRRSAAALADAVADVLLAAVAFGDPELVVLGGPWGGLPAFAEAVGERIDDWPRGIPLVVATLADEPELLGARERAVELLRSAVVASARSVAAQA